MAVNPHKNAFNRIMSLMKKTKKFSEENIHSISSQILLSGKISLTMNTRCNISKGKISVSYDREKGFIVWEPDVRVKQVDYKSYRWSSRRDFHDDIINSIYDFFEPDGYWIGSRHGDLVEILGFSGVSPEDIWNMRDNDLISLIKTLPCYKKCIDAKKNMESCDVKYILNDEVQKRCKNRNGCPVFFIDEDKDEISFPNDYYDGAPNGTKWREVRKLSSFLEDSQIQRKVKTAMIFVPIENWGNFQYKDPVTGAEKVDYMR